MKSLKYLTVASLCVALVCIGALWLVWRFEIDRLMAADSVEAETGLILPPGARITSTQAEMFSLAGGDNYQWLIQSESSLLPWVVENMAPESGGWEKIKELSEFGYFRGKIPTEARFGGLWRGVVAGRDGRELTSYLYLAQDGSVGILTTFRP